MLMNNAANLSQLMPVLQKFEAGVYGLLLFFVQRLRQSPKSQIIPRMSTPKNFSVSPTVVGTKPFATSCSSVQTTMF